MNEIEKKEMLQRRKVLVQQGWIVRVYNVKDGYVYRPTREGYEMYAAAAHYCPDDLENKIDEIQTRQQAANGLRQLIESGLIAHHMNWKNHSEIYSLTDKGIDMITGMLFWCDEKLQKKLNDREAAAKTLKTVGSAIFRGLQELKKQNGPQNKKVRRKKK